MNREQIIRSAERNREAREELSKLIAYFNGEGFSRFGFPGDEDGLTPVQTAIRAMREYSDLLRTDAGSAALNSMLHARLVAKGLVPA